MASTILFVSVQGDEVPLSQEIADWLTRHYGAEHVTHLECGATPSVVISGLLRRRCDAVLLAIGPNWPSPTSPHMAQLHAVLNAVLRRGALVVPILLDQARMPDEQSFDLSLRPLARRQAVRVRPGLALEGDMDAVSRAVDRQLRIRPPSRVLLLGVAAFFVLLILVPVVLTAPDPEHADSALIDRVSTVVNGALFTGLALYALVHAMRLRARGWFATLAIVVVPWVAIISGTMLAMLGAISLGPWWQAQATASARVVPSVGIMLLLAYGIGDAFVVARRDSAPRSPNTSLTTSLRTSLALPAPESSPSMRGAMAQAVKRGMLESQSTLIPDVSAPITNAVFLSYRRSDSQAICDRIYAEYAAAFARALRRVRHLPGSKWLVRSVYGPVVEQPIFRDVDAIAAGADFLTTVRRAVAGCGAMVVIIGPSWLHARDASGRRLDDPRDIVRFEINAALELGKPLHILLVGGARQPLATELPADLEPLAHAPATPLPDDVSFASALPFLPLTGWRRRLAIARALVSFAPQWGFLALIAWAALLVLVRPTPAWVISLGLIPLAVWVAPWLVAMVMAVLQRRWRWLALLGAPAWLLVCEVVVSAIFDLTGLGILAAGLLPFEVLTVLAGFLAILVLPNAFFGRLSAVRLSAPGRNI